jgi:hypothetical protein
MRRAGLQGHADPTDPRLFDLAKAAESQTYCDDIKGMLADKGWRSPNCRPICRGSWCGASGL